MFKFLKTLFGELFGYTLTIGKLRLNTRKVKSDGSLYYNLTNLNLYQDVPNEVCIEVVLPTKAADVAAEYIRRTTSHLGAIVSFDENSDDSASKLRIHALRGSNAILILHIVEAILLQDLAFQYEWVRSATLLEMHSDFFSRDSAFDLEKVKQFYFKSEEAKRMSNEGVEFQLIHYACGSSGISSTQRVTRVSEAFLVDYLEMMEKTSYSLSGRSRIMDMQANKFCLYVFE